MIVSIRVWVPCEAASGASLYPEAVWAQQWEFPSPRAVTKALKPRDTMQQPQLLRPSQPSRCPPGQAPTLGALCLALAISPQKVSPRLFWT